MPRTTTSAESKTDKNRHTYGVPFHAGNDKALEALASAHGVNDPTIGRPLSVPQYIKAVVLDTIRGTHEKRNFSFDLETKLETRNVAIPPEIAVLPQDMQDTLMAMNAADRKSTLAILNAEALRIALASNGSVLAALAAKLSSSEGKAQREQDAAKLEGK